MGTTQDDEDTPVKTPTKAQVLADEVVVEHDRLDDLLRQQASNINDLTENLVTIVHTMDRFVKGLNNRPTKRQFTGILGALFLLLGVTYIQSRDNGVVAAKIESCIDPEGVCAKRGQQQTAGALVQIKCEQVNLINELAIKNRLVQVAVPAECLIFNGPPDTSTTEPTNS